MRGKIVLINARSGIFAVQLEDGDFAVLELSGSYDIEFNDVIKGELDNLGPMEIWNVTKREEISVFGQSGRCSVESARQLIYGP